MSRIRVRPHLLQIKFGRPRYTLPSERIYIPAEPPIKTISIILVVFAVLTSPLWIAAAFWTGVAGTIWLIQNAAWLLGLLLVAFIIAVAHGAAWESAAYRYWFWRQERRVKDRLEKLGLCKPREA